MRQCLWRGNTDNPRQSLAAWDRVCRPKKCGGLGVLNLGLQNEALLLKHLFKFFNRMNVPWVTLIWDTYYAALPTQVMQSCGSFWWRDVMSLYTNFCKLAVPQVHAGNTVVFWLDRWQLGNNVVLLSEKFPRLHSFVIDDTVTVREFMEQPETSEHFHLPLSQEAYIELTQLQDLLSLINSNVESKDIWKWPSKSGEFKSKIYYESCFSHLVVDPIFKWIWKCACTLKFKVFGWLLLMDRLNTRDMMQRRNWIIQDDTRVLCLCASHEDRTHLFFACNFSQRVWNYLGISWIAQPNQSTYEMALSARRDFGHPFFTEVVFTATWNIWTQRNGKIFRNERPSFISWRRNFIHDISLLAHRIKCKYKDSLVLWIASLS